MKLSPNFLVSLGKNGRGNRGRRGRGKIPIRIEIDGSLESDVEYELEAYGFYPATNESSNTVRG